MTHRTLLRVILSLLLLATAAFARAQQYPPYPPPPYPPPPPQQYPQAPIYRNPQPYPRQPRESHNGSYFSPYAMFSAGHYSGIGVGNGTAPTQSGGMTALGGTFGGYVMYPTHSPIGVGVDARLIVENSANSTTFGNKVLAGLVGFRIDGSGIPFTPVVPYFQFEVGGAGTNNGTSTTRTGSFAYQAQFGADFPLASKQIAARLEYGTGQLTGIGTTNHTLQTFSAGIVFHIR